MSVKTKLEKVYTKWQEWGMCLKDWVDLPIFNISSFITPWQRFCCILHHCINVSSAPHALRIELVANSTITYYSQCININKS